MFSGWDVRLCVIWPDDDEMSHAVAAIAFMTGAKAPPEARAA